MTIRIDFLKGSLLLPILFVSFLPNAFAEKYSVEGDRLMKGIVVNLVSRGFCKDTQECFAAMEPYSGHGNQVNFSYYGAKNKEMMNSIIMFVLDKGLTLTSGVPIHLSFRAESRDAQGNSPFAKRPIVDLQVSK